MYKSILLINVLLTIWSHSAFSHSDTLYTNAEKEGISIIIEFTKGEAHNHPLMAVWIEDIGGNFIETLYVARSIGTGLFRHGDNSEGSWKPGIIRRPAALPYWSHKRGIQAEDGLYLPTPDHPVPDAITCATPAGDFILSSNINDSLSNQFRILLEINQPWDWNEYWTNNKYPGDDDYMTSSQPAIIYEAVVDMDDKQDEYQMTLIGHGHYSGKNGNLYTDLSTLTTVRNIAAMIMVRIR